MGLLFSLIFSCTYCPYPYTTLTYDNQMIDRVDYGNLIWVKGKKYRLWVKNGLMQMCVKSYLERRIVTLIVIGPASRVPSAVIYFNRFNMNKYLERVCEQPPVHK
jgi:hypothetical protein